MEKNAKPGTGHVTPAVNQPENGKPAARAFATDSVKKVSSQADAALLAKKKNPEDGAAGSADENVVLAQADQAPAGGNEASGGISASATGGSGTMASDAPHGATGGSTDGAVGHGASHSTADWAGSKLMSWGSELAGAGLLGGVAAAAGSGGGSAAAQTAARILSGSVVDGYVSGAHIYIDPVGHGNKADFIDTHVVTDSHGNFSLTNPPQGSVVAIGGTNIDTNQPNTAVLTAPSGSTVVNPLTTLLQSMVQHGQPLSDAQTAIENALGLTGGKTLTSYDPLAGGNHTTDVAYQQAAAKIATLLQMAGSSVARDDQHQLDQQSALLKAISDTIASAPVNTPLDLSDAATLSDISAALGNNGGVSLTAAALHLASGINSAISNASSLSGISDAQKNSSTVTLADDDDLTDGMPAQVATIDLNGHHATLTVAEASLTIVNTAGGSYSLQDTAAHLAAATGTVGNGAADLTATTAATAAQAAAIYAFTNGPAADYSVTDTAANLLAGNAAALAQAADITVHDAPLTVATASQIVALNTDVSGYDLSDSAANLAAAGSTVGGGAPHLTATTAATAAEAAAIYGYANGHDAAYSVSDTAANLLAGNAAALGHATSVTISDAPVLTVADATPLAALNAHVTGYSLSDSAEHLAEAATVGSAATGLTATTPATMAQAAAIYAYTNGHSATYGISDTAANLLAGNSAVLGHATAISVNGAPALSVADVATLTGLHATISAYSLADTAANLATAPTSVANAATSLAATTPATVAQAEAIYAYANGHSATYSISDTAANLVAGSQPVISHATAIAVSGTPVLSVADATALVNLLAGLNASVTGYSLQDTAANLAAAPAGVANGATHLTATTAATEAEAEAIYSYTHGQTATYSVTDTADNLLAGNATVLGHATAIAVSGTPALALADIATLHGYHATLSGYTLSDTVANLLALATSGGTATLPTEYRHPASIDSSADMSTADLTLGQANALLNMGVNVAYGYNLQDTAVNLANAVLNHDQALGDTNFTKVLEPNDPAPVDLTVAQASALINYDNSTTDIPNGYNVADTAAHVVAALTGSSANDLSTVQGAGSITVSDGHTLTLNVTGLSNLASGTALLNANDTIVLSDANGGDAGVLEEFGGNGTLQIGSGSSDAALYTVDMGTSHDGIIVLAGAGADNVTSSSAAPETFVISAANQKSGASTLNLKAGDVIDLGFALTDWGYNSTGSSSGVTKSGIFSTMETNVLNANQGMLIWHDAQGTTDSMTVLAASTPTITMTLDANHHLVIGA